MGTWPYTFARLEIGGTTTPDGIETLRTVLAPPRPRDDGLPTLVGWRDAEETDAPDVIDATLGHGMVRLSLPFLSPEGRDELVERLRGTGVAFRLVTDGDENAVPGDDPVEVHGATVWCPGDRKKPVVNVGNRHDPVAPHGGTMSEREIDEAYGPESFPALHRASSVPMPTP